MEYESLDEAISPVLGDQQGVAIIREESAFSRDFYAHKYYAPGYGLVRVQEDFDANSAALILLELTSIVPEPATARLMLASLFLCFDCRRSGQRRSQV